MQTFALYYNGSIHTLSSSTGRRRRQDEQGETVSFFSPELSFSASRLAKQKGKNHLAKKRKKKKRDRIYERRQEKGKMRKKVRKLFSIFRGRLSVLFPRPIPSHLFFFFLATFFANPLCFCQANVAIKTHAISLLSIIFLHLDTHLEINLARNSCEETWHLSMLMAIL